MQQIPIRKLYWDPFLMVLNQAAETLARDIADSLGDSAEPLLTAMRQKIIGAYLYDEPENWTVDTSEMRCTHFVPSPETPSILVPCMNPIVWSSTPGTNHKTCVEHTLHECSSGPLPEFNYIQLDELYTTDGSYIYSNTMELVGRYKDGVAHIFEQTK
jgi:hypothetical protein